MRALGDVTRDFQHFDSAAKHQEQLVQARLQVEGFEQRLLVFRCDVEQACDHVGQLGRIGDAFERGRHFGWRLRQQLERFVCALFERTRTTFDFRCNGGGLVDVFHPGDRKRVAFHVPEDAEAAKASDDCTVRLVRHRQIAQHRRTGADRVEVLRADLVHAGFALQHDADRPLRSDGILYARLDDATIDVERNDRSGEQHVGANGKQDQRIVGNRTQGVLRLRLGRRKFRLDRLGSVDGQSGAVVGFELSAHRCAIAILRSRRIKHPFSNSGGPSSMRPGGSGMRRWKLPWGISSLRTEWPGPTRGSGREPLTMSAPGSLKICILASVTPGIAMTTTISPSSSYTSAGGSHAAGAACEAVGRKN